MMGLIHELMVAGLMAAPAAGSDLGTDSGAKPHASPARFICNAEGRCFENGELGDRTDRDDDDRDERRRDRHRHEDDDD